MGNEVCIVSSKGGMNVGVKFVFWGLSFFMGSNWFDVFKKNFDVFKFVVYIFREWSIDFLRLLSIKIIKDYNGVGLIDNVFKILSNLNRNNYGEIILKILKVVFVEDCVSVVFDYCILNCLNNFLSLKLS